MVPRALICLLLVACGENKEAPLPPPPPPPDPPADAPSAAAIDDAAIAEIDASWTDAALTPEMQKVMASPPCCCSLPSGTDAEYETQPRLYCQQDLHGTCVAAARCPKPGSIEAKIAVWWSEVASGQVQAHAGEQFVVEAFVAAGVFTGQQCGMPYVIDMPRTGDECLRLVVANSRPAKWRTGWDCKGFSGTDLAKQVKRDREAAKHTLRCGNRSNAAVFVAVDAAGNVSGFLVNKLDSP